MDKEIALILYGATLDYKLDNNIEVVQLSIEYNRSFASNKGKISVNLENAVKVWTIADFKQFNDILLMSNNAFNHAEYIHNYLVCLVTALTAEKEKLSGEYFAKDRKNIDVFMNRLIKFNQVLSDSYGIEAITAETAPKYKKCAVYAMVKDNEKHKMTVLKFDGYSFVFKGYEFHVYKDDSKTNHIIVPSTGLALNNFKGNIKNSHEYIRELIMHLTKSTNQKQLAECEKYFSALLSDSDFVITYNSIVIAEPTTETAENTAKIEKIKSKNSNDSANMAYIIRFNTIYKKIILGGHSFGNSAKIDFLGYSGNAEKAYNNSELLAFNSSVLTTSNSSVYSALNLSKLNINRGSPSNVSQLLTA